jgi:hypothetical protein
VSPFKNIKKQNEEKNELENEPSRKNKKVKSLA